MEGPTDELFVHVADAAHLPDGGVVVLDAGAQSLRFFNADGSLRTVAGRAGSGPGEFRAPFRLELLPGDTIAVWDFARRILTYWSLNGELLDERPAHHHPTIHEGDLLPNGTVAVPRYNPADPERGQFRKPGELILYVEGEPRSLGTYPYDEMYAGVMDGTPMPFAAKSAFAAGGSPFRIAVADNSHLPRVRSYDDRGELVEEIALHDTRRPLTSALWNAHIESARQRFRGGPEFERKVSDWSRPDSTPALDDLKIDPEGRLWVLRTEDSGVYGTVHVEGEYVAEVRLPDLRQIFEIGRDYIIGLHRGELDVESVQVYGYTTD